MFKNRSGLYLVVIALAMFGGYMVSRALWTDPAQLKSGTALPPRPVAQFSLLDHNGNVFDNSRMQGGTSLFFFGFTHCPDVCPTTLALLSQLQRNSPIPGLKVIFVTVDPQRDDQLTLKRYVDAFGGQFLGLRGEDPALAPLMLSLGAARSIQPLSDGSYAVDHSATLFFVDAKGQLAAVFTPPFSLPLLHEDLLTLSTEGN